MTGMNFTHISSFVCCKSCNCQLSSEEDKTCAWGFVLSHQLIALISNGRIRILLRKKYILFAETTQVQYEWR